MPPLAGALQAALGADAAHHASHASVLTAFPAIQARPGSLAAGTDGPAGVAAAAAQAAQPSNAEVPPVLGLPPPPAAAAAQWAQQAYAASTQAAAARAAAAKAAQVASEQAAAAQAASTQAQIAQVSAQQAAAAQVAQSLGYNVAPIGVPTAATYADFAAPAPSAGKSATGSSGLGSMMGRARSLISSVGPAAMATAWLAPSEAVWERGHGLGRHLYADFIGSIPGEQLWTAKVA